MTSATVRTLTIAATVGAGINGGVFFAFSTFVMRALQGLPPGDGLRAMQRINRAAPSPLFMAALLGTAVLSIVIGVDGVRHWDRAGSAPRTVAAASYLAGVAVTIVYHVPRNNALATVDSNAGDAGATWLRYATAWTRWNHARAATCIASAALFARSLR
jgi:uncharacterized membrane protein